MPLPVEHALYWSPNPVTSQTIWLRSYYPKRSVIKSVQYISSDGQIETLLLNGKAWHCVHSLLMWTKSSWFQRIFQWAFSSVKHPLKVCFIINEPLNKCYVVLYISPVCKLDCESETILFSRISCHHLNRNQILFCSWSKVYKWSPCLELTKFKCNVVIYLAG